MRTWTVSKRPAIPFHCFRIMFHIRYGFSCESVLLLFLQKFFRRVFFSQGCRPKTEKVTPPRYFGLLVEPHHGMLNAGSLIHLASQPSSGWRGKSRAQPTSVPFAERHSMEGLHKVRLSLAGYPPKSYHALFADSLCLP